MPRTAGHDRRRRYRTAVRSLVFELAVLAGGLAGLFVGVKRIPASDSEAARGLADAVTAGMRPVLESAAVGIALGVLVGVALIALLGLRDA